MNSKKLCSFSYPPKKGKKALQFFFLFLYIYNVIIIELCFIPILNFSLSVPVNCENVEITRGGTSTKGGGMGSQRSFWISFSLLSFRGGQFSPSSLFFVTSFVQYCATFVLCCG
ncbi:hypothetical protein NE237_006942 [Protea cynaroides]|uniref:Uncharacterized protein n=1 Tax=Protea cynaroides TaxID=273540 RepID=A0A9Q0QVS2_9MAGN|nr:hypothetical protein NE237_006942 [Protea cynaroides]